MRSLSNLLAGGGLGFKWNGSRRILGGFILFVLCDHQGFNPGYVGVIEAPWAFTGHQWIARRLFGDR
jgi:hypothetical protein